MNKQLKLYLNGLILIALALIMITIIPFLSDKLKIVAEKGIFSELEFFFLTAGALFYLFSPKYYKYQILSIFVAISHYFIFIHFFPLFK